MPVRKLNKEASQLYFPGRHLSRWWQNHWFTAQQTSTSPGVSAGSLLIESTGAITVNSNYRLSAPIRVTPGQIMFWWNDRQDYLNPDTGGYYRANGTYLSGVWASGIYPGHRCLFKVPADAAYVRLNASNNATTRKYWLGTRRSAPTQVLATKIAYDGDSITEGATLFYDKSYPQVITDMTGIPNVNNSDGGRRISGVNGIHTTIVSTDHTAEIGVVLGGVNDYMNEIAMGATDSGNTADFNGGLNALCFYIVNGRPWQRWFLVTPVAQRVENPNGLGLQLRDYCDAIAAAGLRWGITVLDANRDIGFDIRNSSQQYVFGADAVHLNWLGTDMLAQYVLQGITYR